ncbi:HEAT repeat domain-containing protein [Streptomyces lydicus]|uniref:HEAT repeat domain-containing protein n=1 Tax=Streptomyces lydicus TaxID=47763 RepID=UPI0036EF4BD3
MPDLYRVSRRLILRDHVEAGAIRSFTQNSGWTFLGDIARDPERGVFYEAKWESGDGGSVHYVVDEFADVHYMVVANEDPEAAEEVRSRIEGALEVWTVDDMLDDCYVHVYPAGWAKSLLRLGAGAPRQAVEAVVAHVVFSSEHQDTAVRRAAVRAMAYAAWPEFKEALARLAHADEDPHIAWEAGRVLEELEKAGVSEP